VLADLLAQWRGRAVPVELVLLSQAAECHRRIPERGHCKLVLDARA
jgi:hypothetical protein